MVLEKWELDIMGFRMHQTEMSYTLLLSELTHVKVARPPMIAIVKGKNWLVLRNVGNICREVITSSLDSLSIAT